MLMSSFTSVRPDAYDISKHVYYLELLGNMFLHYDKKYAVTISILFNTPT